TQTFFRPLYFHFDFCLSSREQALAFITGFGLGFIDDLVGTLVGLLDQLGTLALGFTQLFSRLVLGQMQIGLSAFSCFEALSNLVLPFFKNGSDRRPDIFHAKPDENEERYRLSDYGCVEIHAGTSVRRWTRRQQPRRSVRLFDRLNEWV